MVYLPVDQAELVHVSSAAALYMPHDEPGIGASDLKRACLGLCLLFALCVFVIAVGARPRAGRT